MPWSKKQNHESCEAGKPWAVVKDNGEVEGCHATEEDANQQLAALYASEKGKSAQERFMGFLEATSPDEGPDDTAPTVAVKFLREEDGGAIVGGHIALWGDPEHKDLQDDYFTPDTWLGLDEYPTVPALFHHGLDPTVGASVIGRRIKAGVDEMGAWVEDWLDTSNKYWAMVKPLLDAEVLHYSPGSAPHLVKRQEDGRLDSYPIVEDTMTVIPAQHRLRPIEQIKAAYKAAGLDVPELEDGEESAGAEEPEAEDEEGTGESGDSQPDTSRSESDKAKARAIELLAEIEMINGGT